MTSSSSSEEEWETKLRPLPRSDVTLTYESVGTNRYWSSISDAGVNIYDETGQTSSIIQSEVPNVEEKLQDREEENGRNNKILDNGEISSEVPNVEEKAQDRGEENGRNKKILDNGEISSEVPNVEEKVQDRGEENGRNKKILDNGEISLEVPNVKEKAQCRRKRNRKKKENLDNSEISCTSKGVHVSPVVYATVVEHTTQTAFKDASSQTWITGDVLPLTDCGSSRDACTAESLPNEENYSNNEDLEDLLMYYLLNIQEPVCADGACSVFSSLLLAGMTLGKWMRKLVQRKLSDHLMQFPVE